MRGLRTLAIMFGVALVLSMAGCGDEYFTAAIGDDCPDYNPEKVCSKTDNLLLTCNSGIYWEPLLSCVPLKCVHIEAEDARRSFNICQEGVGTPVGIEGRFCRPFNRACDLDQTKILTCVDNTWEEYEDCPSGCDVELDGFSDSHGYIEYSIRDVFCR